MSKVVILSANVPAIIQANDVESAELYQDIFLEFGKNNVKKLIEQDFDNQVILNILVDLMGVGYDEDCQIYQNRIRARY